jgi:hypothetical protein
LKGDDGMVEEVTCPLTKEAGNNKGSQDQKGFF